VTELTEPELRQEVLKLRRRARKLRALLRLALALLQTSGFHLSVARLPNGRDKLRILRAVDRSRETSRRWLITEITQQSAFGISLDNASAIGNNPDLLVSGRS